MKKITALLVLAVLATAAFAQINPPATPIPNATAVPKVEPPQPATAVAVMEIEKLTKERDEARGQAQQLQQQQQQTSVVAEYYKATAERNEAILRLNAMAAELEKAKAEIATLKAAAAPKPVTPAK